MKFASRACAVLAGVAAFPLAVSGAPSPLSTPLPIPSAQASAVSDNEVELPDLTLDKDGGIDLTLEESVKIAIRNASAVIRAQNDALVSGAQLLQSYGQFLPNLGATGNYGYTTGTSYLTQGAPALVTGSGTGSALVLQSDLNIFNGLADYSNLKSSLLKKDASDLSLDRARQQIALDITQSFLQVVLDNKIVDIAKKNLQESQARERLLTEQTRLGVRNLSDLFRQQAQTSADESFLLTSQNKTRSDQIVFLRRLRADVAKKYHFIEPKLTDDVIRERFRDESALLTEGLANRTDLAASNKLAEAATWDVKVSRSTYFPKFDLVASVTSGAHYIDNQTVNGAVVTPTVQSNMGYQLGTQLQYAITLNLTWTIFDRFITHENVTRSAATADNLEVDAQDRRNQVEGDVRQAFGDYQTSIQQLRASKKGLDAANKAYEVMDGRYQVGSANFVDLVTVQAALVQAEAARAQALIDFQLQAKNIEFAIGETPVY